MKTENKIKELEQEIERLKKVLAGEAFDHSVRSVELFIKLLDDNYADFGIKRAIERCDLRYNEGVVWTLNDWSFNVETVFGGSEGEGEEHYLVLKLVGDGETSFWKVPGYYSSYDGSELEWDSIHKVTPYQEMVTRYR